MRFSFIVPMWNDGDKAVKTIESIFKQEIDKGDSIEVIAVDNNSTDDTAEVVRKFLGGRGKVISEKQKQGPNAARRTGTKGATGDVFCFIDADTTIPPDWLKGVKKAIAKKFVAVSGPYYYNFRQFYLRAANWLFTWLILPIIPRVLQGVDALRNVKRGRKGAVIIGGNFAVTREALEKIGGIPDVDFFGDDARIAMLLARRAGRVAFSQTVKAHTSPRRYEREGAENLQREYNRAYFREFFDRDND